MIRSLFVFFACLCFVACDSATPDLTTIKVVDQLEPASSFPGACNNDLDCNDDQTCTTDTCVTGLCVNTQPEHCSIRGLVCADTIPKENHAQKFACIPAIGAECISDYDCSEDYSIICNTGKCEPAECATDVECDNNVPCDMDLCVFSRCGSMDMCFTNEKVCSKLSGLCEKPCESNNDCVDKEYCFCNGDALQCDATNGICTEESLCSATRQFIECANDCDQSIENCI